jgi:hypothetical protein
MEPSTYKVASLVEKCARGEFLLPEIQRGFVWKKPQIRDLVDSLYHDYPTGSILGWEADHLPKARTIGEGTKSNGNVELLILDGQQRLTALYTLFGHSIKGRGVINIVFNIQTEQFEIGRSTNSKFPWISVTDVLTKGAVTVAQELDLLNDPNINNYLSRLNQIDRIKEYTYQVYVLRKVTYEQVTDIFQRVNSKGTRLQQSELAIARLAFALPGLISEEMSKFSSHLSKQGYDFRLPFFIRCLHAVVALVANRTPRADFKLFQDELKNGYYSDTQIIEAWNRVQQSIERLVNLLKSNLGIENSKWLISENALVVPVLYLSNSDNPDIKSMILWFLYASMWGRYSGAAETALDQDYAELLSTSSMSFRSLLKQMRREVREEDLRRAGLQSPFKTMLYLICRDSKARDWSKDKIVINRVWTKHITGSSYFSKRVLEI